MAVTDNTPVALAVAVSTLLGRESSGNINDLSMSTVRGMLNVADGATADEIPSGTVMLFWQASVPTGFTQVTTQNDKALRVVSGTAGGVGGTVAFETAFASKGVSGTNTGTAITVAQMPSHFHMQNKRTAGSGAGIFPAGGFTTGTSNDQNSDSKGGDDTHTHTFSGTAIDLDVSYINIMLASKN
jgi:hypothetical protein